MLTYQTPDEAYQATLQTLLECQDKSSPRGLLCVELMNHAFTVLQPTSKPIETASKARNQVIKGYHDAEFMLYMSGEMSADVWAKKASKFWSKIANPDGSINSNYSWLVFQNKNLPYGLTSWEWAKTSLHVDPDTRQAFVRFSLPEHQWFGNRDQPCTMHMHFMVRKEALHGTVVMRSNDVVKGLAYDMPWFCFLLERMAEELGRPVGTYTHIAHSMHLYDVDVHVAKEMANYGGSSS